MRLRPAFALPALMVIAAAGGGLWWSYSSPNAPPPPDIQTSAPMPDEPEGDTLPVPPHPPRIAEDERYDKCLTMLADDPEGAEAIAASWQASGGGDAATHCQALAAIANGEPETGAAMLEQLAHSGSMDGISRVVLLSQAAEARLMADQAAPALSDENEALAISPDDPDLLIGRANANDSLGRANDAIDDLNQALPQNAARGDALVLRAAVLRRLDRLDEARADIDKAVTLDPDDAEALLERGILRQMAGDVPGARQDWKRAQEIDPNSEVAELAAQNLTLLDAGPARK